MIRQSPGASRGRRALLLLRGLSWCVVAYAALQLALVAAADWSPWFGNVLWSFGFVEVLIVGGLGGLLLLMEPAEEAEPARPTLPPLGLGLCLGVALKAPADALRAAIDRFWPTPPEDALAQAELLRHDTPSQIVCLVVVIGLLGPCVEEVFYRAGVFSSFRRALGGIGAVVVTSVLFALSHASPRDWLPLGLVAIALGGLRLISGLLASIAAHVAFNLAALGLLIADQTIDVARNPAWLVAVLGSCALGFWALRALAREPEPRAVVSR
jgi:membrane protease YdiL (CAAX protease family)